MKKIVFPLVILLCIQLFGCTKSEKIIVELKNEYGTNQYNKNTAICKQDDYLYYVSTDTGREIYRYNISNDSKVKIARGKRYTTIVVSGDYVYAGTITEFNGKGDGLYKINTDGSGKKQILKEYKINEFNVCKDLIYFSTDTGLYSADNNGENVVRIVNGSAKSFYIGDNEIYYYLYNNHQLCKYDRVTSDIEVIYENRALSKWIVKDNMLYFIAKPVNGDTLIDTYKSLYSYDLLSHEEKTIYEFKYLAYTFTLYDDKLWILNDILNHENDYLYSKVITISQDGIRTDVMQINSECADLVILGSKLYIINEFNTEYKANEPGLIFELSNAANSSN